MKTNFKLLMFLIAVHSAAYAQVVPAATGPATLPPGGRSLEYAVRYAQNAQFGTSFSTLQTSTASGSLTFINASERTPFTAEYSGGYTWTLTGPAFESGQFQRLFMTQAIDWKKWKLMFSNDASYLPQSPITGFSGIPGIGEPIGVTPTAPASSQSILNLSTHVVENNASGILEYDLSKATTVSIGGGSVLLRYPDGDGLETNTESGNATLVHALNARDSLSATYQILNFTYPDYLITFETNSGLIGLTRRWTRNLTTEIAAGPEMLSSSVVPNSLDVTVNANINYLLRFSSLSLSYIRGTNGGSGYLFGAKVNSAIGNFQKEFGTEWTLGVTGGYQQTDDLADNGSTRGIFAGTEVTRRFGRDLIIFTSYTATTQSSTAALPTNALNQLINMISFGVGYSPIPKRLRQ
jgi:hypothetical protein